MLTGVFPYWLRQQIKLLPGVLALQLTVFRRSSRRQLVDNKSILCIEGFPRSGNGFSTICAWLVAGAPANQTSHHTHSVANVTRAIRRGIPTFVLVRAPRDACLSLVLLGACPNFKDALKAWEIFHRALLPHLSRVTIVPFENLIAAPADYVAVIASALQLPPPIWDRDAEKRVEDTIEKINLRWNGDNALASNMPSSEKVSGKQALEQANNSPETQILLKRCEALHITILNTSPNLFAPTDKNAA